MLSIIHKGWKDENGSVKLLYTAAKKLRAWGGDLKVFGINLWIICGGPDRFSDQLLLGAIFSSTAYISILEGPVSIYAFSDVKEAEAGRFAESSIIRIEAADSFAGVVPRAWSKSSVGRSSIVIATASSSDISGRSQTVLNYMGSVAVRHCLHVEEGRRS